MSETGTWAQYQKLVLKLLEQHEEKLEDLEKSCQENASLNAKIQVTIEALREEIRLLREELKFHESSEGHTLLIRRVELLDTKVDLLIETNANKQKEEKELKNYKRGVLVAIATAVLGILWDVLKQLFLK